MAAFEPSLWELETEIRKVMVHLKDLIGKFPTEMRRSISKEKAFQCVDDLQESIMELVIQSQKKESSCRIASWDLKKLSTQCAKYEEKIETISDTILWYQLDIIAFQEVVEVKALTDVVQSLSRGRCGLWKMKWCDVYSVRHKGVPAKSGFLWNTSRVPIEGPIRFTHYHNFQEMKCRPVSLEFYINDWKLELINFHLTEIDSEETRARNECELKTIHEILQLSRETTKANYNVILLGNFNCYPGRPAHTKHHSLFKQQEITDTWKGRSCDNILVEQELKSSITFKQVADVKTQYGVEAQEISDHLPIWIDLEYSKSSHFCTDDKKNYQSIYTKELDCILYHHIAL